MAISALAISACGGGSPQDANTPSGKFPVTVSAAAFPAHQRLSEHTRLTIAVRNTGRRALPTVAVTICNVTCTYPAPVGEGTSVQAFAQYLNMPGLADHSRPVWIIDRPPGACGYSCANGGEGSDFSYDANTWTAGSLKPGATARFTWAVTAVAPGTHVVAWEISAGLYGKAKAVLANGSIPRGSFSVDIAQAPQQSYVNDKGQVVVSH
jgi:hypothetical protein